MPTGDRARTVADLVEAARAGERVALARLLSLAERGGSDAAAVAREVYGFGGNTSTVGITGSPGAGKSTLTNACCGVARRAGERIAVLAIDPSSPFSGGAILGDRVRMGDHSLDDGVFIRSMATRGQLGGLTVATPAAVRVLDAVGYPTVVIETVGVGQVEVDIAGAADTTVVVVNPGWGDAVQANKAGLMEIADVFAINKADRPGAADTRRDLEQMLALSDARPWTPPIIETEATADRGVEDLWSAVLDHRRHITESGEIQRRRAARIDAELRATILGELTRRVDLLTSTDDYRRLRERVAGREIDPASAVAELLSRNEVS